MFAPSATNWQPCAKQLLAIIGAEPLLRNTAIPKRHGYAPGPTTALPPRLKTVAADVAIAGVAPVTLGT